MSPKLQKLSREIERTRAKITELQTLLPELEKQKNELENNEIVRVVRSAFVTPGELDSFLREYRSANTTPKQSAMPDAAGASEIEGVPEITDAPLDFNGLEETDSES